jgi:hypothetical protein
MNPKRDAATEGGAANLSKGGPRPGAGAFLALLAALVLFGPAARAQDPTGTYGYPCFGDGTCAGGACNARGFCAQCGEPGQLACQYAPFCAYDYRGFRPNAAGDNRRYCGIRTGYAFAPGYCGFAGFPACPGGVCQGASSFDGVSGMCLACGSIEQRCCFGSPGRLCDWGTCDGAYCVGPELGPLPPEAAPPAPTLPVPAPPVDPSPIAPMPGIMPPPSPPRDISRCFSRDGRHELCRRNNCNIPARRERVCLSHDGRHQLCQDNNCNPNFIGPYGPYTVPCYWSEQVAPAVPCYWQ